MSQGASGPHPVKRYLIRAAWSLPYILMLYVLSAGPLYWTIYDAYVLTNGSPLVRAVYYPLIYLADHSDYFSEFLDWYSRLWFR